MQYPMLTSNYECLSPAKKLTEMNATKLLATFLIVSTCFSTAHARILYIFVSHFGCSS